MQRVKIIKPGNYYGKQGVITTTVGHLFFVAFDTPVLVDYSAIDGAWFTHYEYILLNE